MKMLTTIGLTLAALVVLAIVAFFLIGPERVWTAMTGDPDLGPLELASVTRSAEPHDALACSDGLCGDTTVDLALPAYDVAPADAVTALLASATRVNPGLERLDDGSDPLRARLLTRSATMRFPDTTWVEAIDLGDGRSGLRIYSKAKLGYSDMGANLARITAWAEGMEAP